jgi:hypothetical protein
MQTRTHRSHKGVEDEREQWEYRLKSRHGRKGVTRDGSSGSSGSDADADARESQGSQGGTGAVGVVAKMQMRTHGSHKGVETVQKQWE